MKNKPIRGFKTLVGKTIKKIDATGINCVIILTECGETIYIESNMLASGIPVIECSPIKEMP